MEKGIKKESRIKFIRKEEWIDRTLQLLIVSSAIMNIRIAVPNTTLTTSQVYAIA